MSSPPEDDSPNRHDQSSSDNATRQEQVAQKMENQPPPPPPSTSADEPDRMQSLIRSTELFLREILVTGLIIGIIVLVLFGLSGVWPPMVAVESDSMEPHIMTGDLVFIIDGDRLVGDGSVDGTGIVPAEQGVENGYEKFGAPGDVIIFEPDGNDQQTPIIHRAHLWVEAGEDWSHRADEQFVSGQGTCGAMQYCPAPHSGFITHGDNNQYYDQSMGQSAPIKADWVIAKAQLRVPWLGNIRLLVSQLVPIATGVVLAGLVPVWWGIRRRSCH